MFLERRFDGTSDGIDQNPESAGIKRGGCIAQELFLVSQANRQRIDILHAQCENLLGFVATHAMPVNLLLDRVVIINSRQFPDVGRHRAKHGFFGDQPVCAGVLPSRE